MAIYLFLGFYILSYFIFEKLLRRFFKLSVYHLTYDDVYESYLSLATNISAGCGEWLELPINSSNNSQYLSAPLTCDRSKIAKVSKQNTSETGIVSQSSTLLKIYREKYGTKEEQERKRKESLYSTNRRNRLRLNDRPKIKSRRNVGYLPTIYESLPYPHTADSLIKDPIENSKATQKQENKEEVEIVIEESCVPDKKRKKKSFLSKGNNFCTKFSSVQKVNKPSVRKFSCYIENCDLH